ncbi:MAG TPA: DUF2254 domain-containing protein [Gemmataceae bacterium]|nr:DUF2254 domain-containing protein [Gemmataceae bacterium]
MSWEQRYRLKHAASTSLVLWAVLALVGASLCAPAVRWLDQQTGWVVFHYSPEGARAVLGMLAGSMLTFLVFVLSATLIVVQLASGQLTPRVIALVLAKPGVKIALGTITFTYTYTLAALARVEDRVPDLHVSVSVFLNLVCIIVFFEFVQQLSIGLRPASLVLFVANRGREVIEQVYPATYDPKRPEGATREALPTSPAQVVGFAGRSGVVMAFSVANLVRLARDTDVVIELVPQVGDSVTRRDPLFRVFGGTRPVPESALRGCVAVGTERTLEQDPRFAFRILVDIANKALSPAINDPTTAVLALDQIDSLLLCLGRRRLDEGIARDRDGKLRLVYGTPDWPDYVMLAVSEIRHYGAGSIQVGRRLRAMLENLIRELPADRRPPLEEELALLGSAVERGFRDEEDRKRAGVADYQGVGGSES